MFRYRGSGRTATTGEVFLVRAVSRGISQPLTHRLSLRAEALIRSVHVLYLNNQNQLIAGETLFTGTINRTEVHPREVIKRALYHNAAAVVLAHNHPSGEVTPSKADRLITERLVQALGLVDIRVPDHLIVGGNQVFSFAEHGLL
ncbi:hypothetical protein M8213_003771 [Escherichia coli]|nr:hypothetical protein [Escherichia coli]